MAHNKHILFKIEVFVFLQSFIIITINSFRLSDRLPEVKAKLKTSHSTGFGGGEGLTQTLFCTPM